jgi:tRNA U55 pseudouridine synthase TruB
VGPLTIERALTIEEVRSRLLLGKLADDLISLDQALAGLPALVMEEAAAVRALHGVPVPFQAIRWDVGSVEGLSGQPVRLKDQAGRLLALGRMPRIPAGEPEVSILAEASEQLHPASHARPTTEGSRFKETEQTVTILKVLADAQHQPAGNMKA